MLLLLLAILDFYDKSLGKTKLNVCMKLRTTHNKGTTQFVPTSQKTIVMTVVYGSYPHRGPYEM